MYGSLWVLWGKKCVLFGVFFLRRKRSRIYSKTRADLNANELPDTEKFFVNISLLTKQVIYINFMKIISKIVLLLTLIRPKSEQKQINTERKFEMIISVYGMICGANHLTRS